MHFIYGSLFAYVLCAYLIGCETKEHDESDWLDPNDLINYDPITKTMRSPHNSMNARESKTGTMSAAQSEYLEEVGDSGNSCASNEKLENNNCSKCESEVARLLAELGSCNATMSDLKKQTASCKALHQQAFFHQYVNALLDKFKNFQTLNDGHYEVELKMTTEQFAYLQKYSDGEFTSTQEVHSILSSMFRYSRWKSSDPVEMDGGSELWSLVLEHWKPVVQIICAVNSSLLVCIHCRRSPLLIILLFFIISFLWTWYHLYLKEKATHLAKQHKVPESCESSWGSWISSYFFLQTDECAAFYESITIDPIVAVPPTKALAVLIIRFLLEPAEHLGDALNKLIRAALSELPFYLGIPVFVLIVLLLVLSIFVLSGYRIRTLFFTIEPHRPSDTGLSQRLAELEADNTRLRLAIAERPRRAAGIEDVGMSLLQLSQSQNQQFQQPQGALRDRRHQRSAELQHMLTGTRGEGDGLLENKAYGERGSRISTGAVRQLSQPAVVNDAICGISTETFHQNDQPTVGETDSACKDDQPSVNETQTVVGLTTDTDSCQDDWLVVNQVDTANHLAADCASSTCRESTDKMVSESHASLMENSVAASELSLQNSNVLSPQTLCADAYDSQLK